MPSHSTHNNKGTHIALLLLLLWVAVEAWGALKPTQQPLFWALTAQPDSLQAAPNTPQKERIFIEQANVLLFDHDLNPDAQILHGNVIFRHNDAYMHCDSALLYEKNNRFEAYGNVRIDQGDSLHIYCNYLDYDGNTQLARLRELVRMEHGQNTLFTDSLDYDRLRGVGYYFEYGTIVDSLNTLSSIYGEYDTTTKQATFNDSVRLENPNFTLLSDTLHYDTTTKLATILGPTTIQSDSGTIVATRGTYNTEQDRAYLMDRAELTSGTRWMTGDSIYYNRPQQLTEMYGNIILRDTANHIQLQGNYATYHEDTGYGMATDSAYIVEYSSPNDSLYVHAKLLEMTKQDSITHIWARHNVRLYRSDVQAVSDSLHYHGADSLLHCLGNPFIWSGHSQVKGDSITIYLKNGAVHHAHIRPNAYLASEVPQGGYYDQMRGREVLAYFSNNEMDSVWTRGNAEVIYYSLTPDSLVQEQVRSQSSAILIEFKEQEIEKIKLLDKTTGKITPVPLVKEGSFTFDNFLWFPQGRPTSFLDIFRSTPSPTTTTTSPSSQPTAPPPSQTPAPPEPVEAISEQ